ncbi:uncharacterized protein LOC111946472 [Oryzias latipes]
MYRMGDAVCPTTPCRPQGHAARKAVPLSCSEGFTEFRYYNGMCLRWTQAPPCLKWTEFPHYVMQYPGRGLGTTATAETRAGSPTHGGSSDRVQVPSAGQTETALKEKQDGEVLGVHRSHKYPGISFGVPADVVLQFLNSTPADASQPRPSALASLFRSLQPACRMEESNSPMAPLDQTQPCQQLQHQFA